MTYDTQITRLLFMNKQDEIITSIVVDEDTFNFIWDTLGKCELKNQLDDSSIDIDVLSKIREFKRIPIIQKSNCPEILELFEKLEIATEKFCGILRGSSKIKFPHLTMR